ncbi:hypothetical protein KY289_035483 [Solanum tuberosum]|nr:hypothetical protein KY289_035483 [Solanum tuberosum]
MGDTTPSSGTTRNPMNSIVTNPTSIIVQQDNSPFPTGVILAKKPEQTDSGYAIWITENHKEIDNRTNTQDGSVEGILQMHSMMARLRVHIFLNGLDAEFDQRSSTEADYGRARLIHESSAMAVHRSSSVKGRTNQSFSRPTNLICSHCGESGHLKQRCYEIIGYPDWWEFSKKPRKVIPNRAVVTTSSGTNHPNNDGKIEPRVNLAQPGITDNNNVNVNVTAPSTNSTWIIDSGASDHMTKDPITIIKTIFSALYFYR